MHKILLGILLAAIVATGALAATESFGDADRLYACVRNENGSLVSWSAGGGAGTTFTTVTESVAAPSPGPPIIATANCPAGGRVVGGGAQADPVGGGNVLASYPAGATAWTAAVVTNPAAQSVIVYAICAMQ
jgi:hypothetical protein